MASGYATGTFYARGWQGMAADSRGSSSTLTAHGSTAICSVSDRLAAHWPMLDDFEEGYDRVPVEVTDDDGQQISAQFISFSPGVIPAALRGMVQQPSAIASLGVVSANAGILAEMFPPVSDTQMTKLTLQEQMLKAGLVSSKKMAKVQRTAKKSRVQAREAREAVEEK